MQLLGSQMVCVRTTTWRQHSRSCTGCRSSNGSTINCAFLWTKRLFAKRHPIWLACWLQSLMSHQRIWIAAGRPCIFFGPTTIDSSRRVKRQLRHFQDPSEIRQESVFCCRPRAWNCLPTELKLMRSTPVFKRSLKTFLFQTAHCRYLQDRTFKLDSVMRSSCRRRTKSIVDYDYDHDYFNWKPIRCMM